MYELENGTGRSLATVNVYLGDTRLVSKVVPTDGQITSYEQQNTYYYHSDHIGNSTLVTDYQAREYERLNFTPHGEVWQEESLDTLDKIDFLFTGKQMDAETGWYNFGKRYLDPKIGLWLSADPALSEYLPNAPLTDDDKKHNENLLGNGGIYNAVNFALYHFAGNNPIRYTDPDGKASDALRLVFSKSDQTLTVYMDIANQRGQISTIQMGTYVASSTPSTGKSPAYPTTMTSDEPYYPTSYPNGTWKITDVQHPDLKEYGHTKLMTNTTQSVPTYEKGKDGTWQPTGRTAVDSAYRIHGGGYTKNNEFDPLGNNNYQDKTWGCIRMKNSDVNQLGDLVQKFLNNKDSVTLTVQD